MRRHFAVLSSAMRSSLSDEISVRDYLTLVHEELHAMSCRFDFGFSVIHSTCVLKY